MTRSVGPKEAALKKARESKAGGKRAVEGDPEARAEQARGEEDGPAKVAQGAEVQEAVAVAEALP